MTCRSDRRRVFAKRFRTSMCQEFVETGTCKYGFDCLYAHTADQLRTEDMNRDVTSEMVVQWAKEQRQSLSAIVLPPPLTPDWSLSVASLPSALASSVTFFPAAKAPRATTNSRPAYFQRATDPHCLPLRRLQLVKGLSNVLNTTREHQHHTGAIASGTTAKCWSSPRMVPYSAPEH